MEAPAVTLPVAGESEACRPAFNALIHARVRRLVGGQCDMKGRSGGRQSLGNEFEVGPGDTMQSKKWMN